MPSVPMWQVIIPIAGLIVLGYTIYRNVWPYPSGDFAWFPIVDMFFRNPLTAVLLWQRPRRCRQELLTTSF